MEKRIEFCSHPIQLAANFFDPKFVDSELNEDETLTAFDEIIRISGHLGMYKTSTSSHAQKRDSVTRQQPKKVQRN